jgi:hypothetical protein
MLLGAANHTWVGTTGGRTCVGGDCYPRNPVRVMCVGQSLWSCVSARRVLRTQAVPGSLLGVHPPVRARYMRTHPFAAGLPPPSFRMPPPRAFYALLGFPHRGHRNSRLAIFWWDCERRRWCWPMYISSIGVNGMQPGGSSHRGVPPWLPGQVPMPHVRSTE